MSDRFEARTAVVTGAGSGIGRAVAIRMAAEGARVIATDIRADRVDEVVAEIAALGRAEPVGVLADIGDADDIAPIVEAASGSVDVLANVAGIMDGFIPVGEVDDATWERVMAVNLTGPMRLTRALLPTMTAAGRGSIVNVASEASLRASASGAAYTTSKHGLIGLTRSTAVMYGPAGIRCNAVCPGATVTNIEATPRSEFAMGIIGKYFATIPPPATAEEVAAAVCWLASPDSANVNGAVLASDGGWSAA